MTDSFDLSHKTAIVTGATRGIGRSIALSMARCGASVVVAARTPDDVENVAREIAAFGGRCLAVPANLGRHEDVERLVSEALLAFDRVDVLVNNVGIGAAYGPLIEAEERSWDRVMDVNVKGAFLLTRLVAREMLKRRQGSIINISSTEAISPSGNLGIYAISKAALGMMTKVFSRELGEYGIRVNTIVAGLVETRFSEFQHGNPVRRKWWEDRIPLQRIGQPQDIADVALFLAADHSRYVTGAAIVVDGGYSA